MRQKMGDQDWYYQPVLEALPDNLKRTLRGIPESVARGLEEIRIREGRPLMVYSHGRDYFLCKNGSISLNPKEGYIVTNDDTQKILQLISDYSIYALQEELKNGYVTLKGGYRVGLAGKAVVENGSIKTLKYINSFNIRITREILGVADKVMPYIVKGGQVLHSLILSPPQMGKTTLVRDIVRKLSDGFTGFQGVKVAVVDERSEIAGCYHGVPQNTIGIRTDILDACPKAVGIMMLIRSMSPNVIVTDEIGRPEDVSAIEEALNSGIKVITTAHSRDLDDAKQRPILSRVLENKIFERIFILGDTLGVGTLEKVYDGYSFKQINNKPIR